MKITHTVTKEVTREVTQGFNITLKLDALEKETKRVAELQLKLRGVSYIQKHAKDVRKHVGQLIECRMASPKAPPKLTVCGEGIAHFESGATDGSTYAHQLISAINTCIAERTDRNPDVLAMERNLSLTEWRLDPVDDPDSQLARFIAGEREDAEPAEAGSLDAFNRDFREKKKATVERAAGSAATNPVLQANLECRRACGEFVV